MNITDPYAQHLIRIGLGKNSIRSYLSDVHQFLLWKEKYDKNSPIRKDLIDKYLRSSSFTKSTHTTKRKAVSLNKFYLWLNTFDNSSEIIKTKNKRPTVVYAALTGALMVLFPLLLSESSLPIQKNNDITSIENSVPYKVETEIPTSISNFSHPIEIAVSGYEIQSPVADSDADVILELQNKIEDIAIAPTAGKGIIDEGSNHTVIFNDEINEDSIIIVSASTSLNGENLFIKGQGDGYVIIALDNFLDRPVSFNWLLVY